MHESAEEERENCVRSDHGIYHEVEMEATRRASIRQLMEGECGLGLIRGKKRREIRKEGRHGEDRERVYRRRGQIEGAT